MKSSISMSDIALGLTIFGSTILCWSSCVMCIDNESGPGPEMTMMNSQERFTPGQGVNERYFRNYYEMLHDTEPVWKRAPAPGFFGMRGKKVPSSTFYGMRGKKGPSGFLGMRGKKSQDSGHQLTLANGGPLVDLVSPLANSGLKLKGAGLTPGGLMDSYDDYSLFGVTGPSARLIPLKRAPAEGFMGLRGKRSPDAKSMGKPAHSYQ